jgi:hypothetical protein
MNILPGFKLCRKGLHQYQQDKKRCPVCRKNTQYKWNAKNPECNKNSSKKWYAKNKKKARKTVAKWEEKNKEAKRIYSALYRAAKKQAVPRWVNMKAIAEIYKQAVELTKATGIPHEVDHIYPLKSKYMCGLHVETNLQILTKAENAAKNNRSWPGQLECQKN